MALFSRVTTWVSNQVLTAAALNGEFNNLLNNAVSSSYIGFSANVSQMQQQTTPGGVGTESLAGSISDELQRLRFMTAFLSGKTYWYDQTGSTLGTGGVSMASLAAVNYAVSTSSTSGFTTTSNVYTDVTNATVTLTSKGKPTLLCLIPDGAGTALVGTSTQVGGSTTSGTSLLKFIRGSTDIAITEIGSSFASTNATNALRLPPSMFWYLDTGATSGSTTWKIQVNSQFTTTTTTVNNCKLLALELF